MRSRTSLRGGLRSIRSSGPGSTQDRNAQRTWYSRHAASSRQRLRAAVKGSHGSISSSVRIGDAAHLGVRHLYQPNVCARRARQGSGHKPKIMPAIPTRSAPVGDRRGAPNRSRATQPPRTTLCPRASNHITPLHHWPPRGPRTGRAASVMSLAITGW
jgi:hypothetical protein